MDDELLTTFYFVRHGETRWNYEGRWQGWQDSPLTEKGQEQARAVAERLRNVGATHLVSSDAGRALQTAQAIAAVTGLTPEPTDALRERFYGEYEGMTSDEIEGKFPGTRYAEGRDRRDTWRPIGGETLVEVSNRVRAFVRQAAQSFPGEKIIAVTHAGVLRVLDSLSSGDALDDIWDRVPPNCALFEPQANAAGDLRVVTHFV